MVGVAAREGDFDNARPPLQPIGFSSELVESLSLDESAKAHVRYAGWIAHIELDLTGPQAMALHPSGMEFIRDGLADRFPVIAQSSTNLFVTYLSESDEACSRATVAQVGREISALMQLGPAAIVSADILPMEHPGMGGHLRPVN